MSIMYCDKHDEYYDSDFVCECSFCEEEMSEQERQDEIQEDTTSMEEKLEELLPDKQT